MAARLATDSVPGFNRTSELPRYKDIAMNPSVKLRWGILGAARVNERLLPAIVEAPNSELVASVATQQKIPVSYDRDFSF